MQRSNGSESAPVPTWEGRLARRTLDRDPSIGAILALANASGVINFSGGFPDPATFPTGQISAAAGRLFDRDPAVTMQYTASEGLASVRHALADRLAVTQGHRPDVAEVMVTSGGIDALTLLARAMLDPGDAVVLESPSYVGAVVGFHSQDAQMVGIPLDDEGLVVDALAERLAEGLDPKLVYVIPDHQNPTGRTMSLARRTALVELCARSNVLVVEDVAYRELSFDGQPLPSLWSLRPDTVVQIGTFSKTLFPGIRLGWAVGPREIVQQMAAAKQNTDQCAGALGQRLMESALREGWYDDHLPLSRKFYADRGAALTEALAANLSGVAHWTVPTGGFFSWVIIPDVDTAELARRAAERGVAFVPGGGFFPDAADGSHLRLSYSRVEESDMFEGMSRLRTVIDTMRVEAGITA